MEYEKNKLNNNATTRIDPLVQLIIIIISIKRPTNRKNPQKKIYTVVIIF